MRLVGGVLAAVVLAACPAVLTVSKTNGFRRVSDEHYDEVRRIFRWTTDR